MAPDRVVLEVEAALFSAGEPVSVDALAETTGEDASAVRDALEDLQADYADRTTAMEVAPAGDRWTMQVQTDYADQVRELAPMEVPDKALKTLALVAYHQPILQSDLQTMVGSKVYDHVRELSNLGLVTKRRHERTYELRTTDKFPEYFGLETTDPDEIRDSLAEAAGLPEPPEPEDGPGPEVDGTDESEADEPDVDPEAGDEAAETGPETGSEAPGGDASADAGEPRPARSPRPHPTPPRRRRETGTPFSYTNPPGANLDRRTHLECVLAGAPRPDPDAVPSRKRSPARGRGRLGGVRAGRGVGLFEAPLSAGPGAPSCGLTCPPGTARHLRCRALPHLRCGWTCAVPPCRASRLAARGFLKFRPAV
jgi:segregation and condensation protein B